VIQSFVNEVKKNGKVFFSFGEGLLLLTILTCCSGRFSEIGNSVHETYSTKIPQITKLYPIKQGAEIFPSFSKKR
jgi:hypothetical protein